MPTAASRIASQLTQDARIALQSFVSLTIPVTPALEELEGQGLVVRDPTFAFRDGDTKLVTFHVCPLGRAVIHELIHQLQEDQEDQEVPAAPAPAPAADLSVCDIDTLLVAVARMGSFLGAQSGTTAVLREPRVAEALRESLRVLSQSPGLGYPKACPVCGSAKVAPDNSSWRCQDCNYSRGLGDVPKFRCVTSPLPSSVGPKTLIDFEVTSVEVYDSDPPTYLFEIDGEHEIRLNLDELDEPKKFRSAFIRKFARYPLVPDDEEAWSYLVNCWLSNAEVVDETP
jgi:hypothetical protein